MSVEDAIGERSVAATKTERMENYSKGEVIEIEDGQLPFSDLEENFVHMKVKVGSRISNIVGYSLKQLKEEHVKQIVFSGSGNAVSKTVSCAEIIKRKLKTIQQITKINLTQIDEIWEPKLEGLDRLRVVREIPTIHILLSKSALNQDDPGYQDAGKSNVFSNQAGYSKTGLRKFPRSSTDQRVHKNRDKMKRELNNAGSTK